MSLLVASGGGEGGRCSGCGGGDFVPWDRRVRPLVHTNASGSKAPLRKPCAAA